MKLWIGFGTDQVLNRENTGVLDYPIPEGRGVILHHFYVYIMLVSVLSLHSQLTFQPEAMPFF